MTADKHVILTLGRSGSNTLSNLLNQHPNILNVGEVMGDWNKVRKLHRTIGFPRTDQGYLDAIYGGGWRAMNLVRSAKRLMNGRFGDIKLNVRSVGIKELLVPLRDAGLSGYFAQRPDIKVIGLQRQDVGARMLSAAMLSKTGKIATREKSKPQTIRLDPDKIETKLKVVADEHTELATILQSLRNKYSVDYHDFFSSEERREEITRELFEFLGVKHASTQVQMFKLNTLNISEAIENYNECLEALEGSPYRRYIEVQTADKSIYS